jgi:hypothetical protein
MQEKYGQQEQDSNSQICKHFVIKINTGKKLARVKICTS